MQEHSELSNLGWSDWFEQQSNCEPGQTFARVAAVDRELLVLVDGAGAFRGKLAGSYLHHHQLSHELPCVGDWVLLEKQDGFGVVHAVLERRTSLRRKSAGKVVDYQMIAANVDCVVIVQSCQEDFNINRLHRYIVMVMDGGAAPMILLTKTDLVEAEVLRAQLAEIRSAGINAPIMTLSNVTGQGIERLQLSLSPGKTYCFVGSSGVGKSTLINRLMGREALETNTVSGTGEGRHTTVRRELIRLDGGALVIDNPGMREFGVIGAESGLASSHADIASLAEGCRFRDCTHTGEPGCAVLEAVESGELDRDHYDNFVKLRDESEFHEMSYAQKRKKDRDFGKFVKSVKKNLKD
jgi:ribosome biogenesis GTPase / thiamine phosphate phosphatase